MSDYQCTRERFLRDVSSLEMTVIKDEGVWRHLQFKKPGSSVYSFDLLTWPGHLCITGDCGTYIFQRIEDMFEFFWQGDMKINPGYWSEKLLATDRVSGYEKYSAEVFRACVRYEYDQFFEDYDYDWKDECWSKIESRVLLPSETEQDAHDNAGSFRFKEFYFHDFWEYSLRDYTFRYIWCLYGIVWGVKKYRETITSLNCPQAVYPCRREKCQGVMRTGEAIYPYYDIREFRPDVPYAAPCFTIPCLKCDKCGHSEYTRVPFGFQ